MKKRSDKQCSKPIRRKLPIVDMEIDFSVAINYSPPVRKERYKIKASKSFNEVPPKNYPSLFVMKCEECSHVFNFQNSQLYQKEIEIKYTLLLHLISGFDNASLCRSIGPQQFNVFLEMVRKNTFRALPAIMIQDCDINDISWPHLKLVYCCIKKSLFFNYYNSISSNFLYNLIKNIASYDKRERAYVCDISYELYLKHVPIRTIICRCISALLSISICSNELFQLIFALSSNFNSSFDNDFFIEYILPVHLLDKSNSYKFLIDCDLVFTRNDPSLFPFIFQYLLNHWPITNMKKCPFFLKIIVKLFELFFNNQINENAIVTPEMANAFFDVVSLCSHSEYTDAAAYALRIIALPMIQDIYQVSIIKSKEEEDYDEDYPVVISNDSFFKLYQSVIIAENHWDETVRSCTLDAKLMLSKLDPTKFKIIRGHMVNERNDFNNHHNRIDEGWNIILRQAKRRYRSIKFNSKE